MGGNESRVLETFQPDPMCCGCTRNSKGPPENHQTRQTGPQRGIPVTRTHGSKPNWDIVGNQIRDTAGNDISQQRIKVVVGGAALPKSWRDDGAEVMDFGVYNGHQRIDGRKVQADTEPGGKATNGHFVPAVTHGKLLTAAELQERQTRRLAELHRRQEQKHQETSPAPPSLPQLQQDSPPQSEQAHVGQEDPGVSGQLVFDNTWKGSDQGEGDWKKEEEGDELTPYFSRKPLGLSLSPVPEASTAGCSASVSPPEEGKPVTHDTAMSARALSYNARLRGLSFTLKPGELPSLPDLQQSPRPTAVL